MGYILVELGCLFDDPRSSRGNRWVGFVCAVLCKETQPKVETGSCCATQSTYMASYIGGGTGIRM